MPGTQDAANNQSARPENSPKGTKVLVVVNALAALALLAMFPQYSGGRALLYLCVGSLHGLLAFGLFQRYGWASVVMIVYGLFQVAGIALWSLIGLMTLVAEPLTPAKAQFLLFAAVAIPFLAWSVIYLLRQLKTS
jgi:hypothetical protein